MKAGYWNIAFGLVAVGAGVSGRFALLGTDRPIWLIVAGGALTVFGMYQLGRDRDKR
jgi:cytochrome c biogenesis protein CcdA